MELGHFFYDLLVHNEGFVEKSEDTQFSAYEDQQHPPITMLTCADSRIQGKILGMDLINKVFTVRNAGNQVARNKGSLAYALTALNTPIFFILGHTNCGAVNFAAGASLANVRKLEESKDDSSVVSVTGGQKKEGGIQLTSSKGESKIISSLKKSDFSAASREVQREMLPLTIPIERGIAHLVKIGNKKKELAYLSQVNVDYQVEKALEYYGDRVKENKLAIVGGIYDFVGAYSDKRGRVVVTNINGIYEEKKLQESAMAFCETDNTLDKSSESYKLCCKLIEEKVSRI
ncbi:carbonic anhydrase [Candidatus Scalindua japonica]|uniref:carbonic anhydrase n=1 Tax=Candidatus Scalindua japonica TaxID=1284222 RepID=A0A286TTN8_9BACT|nr:carbonic anhydrase [Candidatus Scalindua japonica]GAX59238.1 carbonic anhydrase [Candidatus Scalindua japonica]